MFITDAHEDIAYNALVGGRDFRVSVADKRKQIPDDNAHGREGLATVGLPDLLQGEVGLVFGTLFASPARSAFGGEARQGYTTPQEAEAQGRAQLDYYRRIADEDERVTLIHTRGDLEAHLKRWQDDASKRQVGIVVLMEGADPIVQPDDVKRWYDDGVRIVGLSWSQSRYAGGTRAPGPLTDDGKKLLKLMNEIGMVWDVSHLAEESFFQGLDIFQGRVIASHSNCRQYVPTDRHLSDDMLRALIERDAVIGCVLFNRFLRHDWEPKAGKHAVTLREDVMRHIDRICQLAGDAKHVGIGSDFDGGFGTQSIPSELDSVADLPKLAEVLKAAGYKPDDVEGVMGGNWVRVMQETLPK